MILLKTNLYQGSNGDVEPLGVVDEELDVSGRCGDELVVVVDEDLTHRILNPRALSPTVGVNVDGLDQR